MEFNDDKNKETPPLSKEQIEEVLLKEELFSVSLPAEYWYLVIAALSNTCNFASQVVNSETLLEKQDSMSYEEMEILGTLLMGPFLTRALIVESLAKDELVDQSEIESMGLDNVIALINNSLEEQESEFSC